MTRNGAGKRAEWQKRLDDFENSGLTVAEFCSRADVTPHTFYYWNRQLRRSSDKRCRTGTRQPGRRIDGEVATTATDGKFPGPLVTFTWGSTLRVSVPAHCVEAIRCVLECTCSSGHTPGSSSKTFQEVVLAE